MDSENRTNSETKQIVEGAIGLVILIGAIILMWNILTKDEGSTPIQAVESNIPQEVTDIPPLLEPIIQIATLYGVPMSTLSEQFDTNLNDAGNLIVDTDEFKLVIESKDSVKSDYVEVQVKSLGTCSKANVSRNSDNALELVGLKPDLKENPTNPPAGISNGAIEYCGYPNTKFSVGTSCMYDGGFYDVSLSPRTYCGD